VQFQRYAAEFVALQWRLTRLEFEASFIGFSIVFALESMSRKVRQHQLRRSNNQA
jgi:hypothetical protein